MSELIYMTRYFVQSLRDVGVLKLHFRDDEIDEQLEKLDSGGDEVMFAWWVGSKMPVNEYWLYYLLLQTGAKELYYVLHHWIRWMEKSWYYRHVVLRECHECYWRCFRDL